MFSRQLRTKWYLDSTTTLQIWEIRRKVVFFEILLHWFKVYELQSVWYKKIFPRIQLEIPSIHCTWVLTWDSNFKCQKGTGSAWETIHCEKLCFLQSIHLQCSIKIKEISCQNDKADGIEIRLLLLNFFKLIVRSDSGGESISRAPRDSNGKLA